MVCPARGQQSPSHAWLSGRHARAVRGRQIRKPNSDRLSAVERLCHLIQINVLERGKRVNCLGATSAKTLAPGSRSLRPPL
jgi:hypothetical protein